MGKANKVYTNTIGGEVTPLMRARLDLPIGQKSVARMENFIARPEGGASFRLGTYVVSQSRYNRKAWMAEFQFSDQQAYELELTDRAIRFYKNNQVITETPFAIEGVDSTGLFNVQGHNFVNGDEIFIDGVVGPDTLNGRFFMVANATANTFTLQDSTGSTEKGEPLGISLVFTAADVTGAALDISGLPDYVSGGTVARVYSISTPYLEADLEAIQYAQDADTMYVVHRNYPPMKLVRAGNTSWTIATYARTNDPFTSAGNYPGVVCFIDSGRLIMGSTINHPSSLWASQSPSTGVTAFDNFHLGTTPTSAIQFTLNPLNGKVDAIRWIANTSKFVVVGCFGSLRLLYGNSLTEAISPIAVQAKGVNNYAAAAVTPLVNGTSLFYVQRGGKILRSLEYDFLQDWYDTVDRNLVTKHLTLQGIRKVVAQQGDPDLVWAVMNDGKLIAMTYNQKEDIAGWHRHYIGGSHIDANGILQPWANVISAGSMPRDDGHDQLWLSVERYINGQTIRTIEYVADEPNYPNRNDFFTGDEEADDLAYLKVLYETQKTANHLDMAVAFDATSQAALTLAPGANETAGAWVKVSGPLFGEKQLVKIGKSGIISKVVMPSAPFTSTDLAVDERRGRAYSQGASASLAVASYVIGGGIASESDAFNPPIDVVFTEFKPNAGIGSGTSTVLSADGNTLYVAAEDRTSTFVIIVKIDVQSGNVIGSYQPGITAFAAQEVRLMLTNDGGRLYFEFAGIGAIFALDTQNMTVAAILQAVDDTGAPSSIFDMVLSDDGSTLCVAVHDFHSSFNIISTIDFSMSVFSLRTIYGVLNNFNEVTCCFAANDAGSIYLTGLLPPGLTTGALYLLSTSGAIEASYPLGFNTQFITRLRVDPADGAVYMLDDFGNAYVFDPATQALTTITLPGEPNAIPVFDRSGGVADVFYVTADRDTFAPDSIGRTVISKPDSQGNNGGSGTIIQYISPRQVVVKQTSPFDSLNGLSSANWYFGDSHISGLQVLEGETVGVIADGGAHRDCIVKDGAIQLDFPASVVIVGYKYRGTIESLNLDIGGVTGSAQGKARVIPHAILNFLNSVGTKFGTSIYKLKAIITRKMKDLMDRPTPPFTGNDKVVFRDGYTEMDKKVVIVQDVPLPCTIIGIDVYAVAADD